MKKYISLLFLILFLLGCKKENKPHITHYRLQTWEMNLVPYKLGDTLSFTKVSDGTVYHYKCIERSKTLWGYGGDSTTCDPNRSPYCEYTYIDQLSVRLRCIENSAYYIVLFISGSGYEGRRGILETCINNCFQELEPLRDFSSPCHLSSKYPSYENPGLDTTIVECLNTLTINNKTYSDISRAYNLNSNSVITDTVYFTKTSGIVKFFLATGNETWVKN